MSEEVTECINYIESLGLRITTSSESCSEYGISYFWLAKGSRELVNSFKLYYDTEDKCGKLDKSDGIGKVWTTVKEFK